MNKKKVIVAMSGGVDSSVAAALLQEQEFSVIGITMQIWDNAGPSGGCCGFVHTEDSRRVASMLDIPHAVLNFKDIFEKKVISDFCHEYLSGRTPNPCIRCNQYIKFEELFKYADSLDAFYIATGHYAGIKHIKDLNRYVLQQGADTKKDQSYVLYTMAQEQLKRIMFPLAGLTKKEVREIARKKRLPVADKEESQEICFVQNNRYADFVKDKFSDEVKSGAILDLNGREIGLHKGIIFYTIGQRRWIGIAAKKPLYVIAIDRDNNSITVGGREDAFKDKLTARAVNTIAFEKLDTPIRVMAKIRYQHKLAAASVFPMEGSEIKVKFDSPQWAVTPGQAVVCYISEQRLTREAKDDTEEINNTVLCGGTIS